MIKPSPIELAELVKNRSICNVQVGAVIYDKHGIISWGWNHSGSSGFGLHAEHHAISRANKSRLVGSTIVVLGTRKKSKSIVMSFPCESCMRRIIKSRISYVVFQDKNNNFHTVNV